MVVSGGTATVQAWAAGVGSTLWSGSIAWTRTSWRPSPRFLYSTGVVQDSKSAPFSEHSKIASGSSAVKLSVALGLALGSAGPATLVSGGIAIVQPWVAGVGSTALTLLVARTSKL